MKTKIPHCRNIKKNNRKQTKIAERGKIDTPNTPIHDRSLSWLGTGTSTKRGGVNLQCSFMSSAILSTERYMQVML